MEMHFLWPSPLDRGWEIITRKTIPYTDFLHLHPSLGRSQNNEQDAFFPSLSVYLAGGSRNYMPGKEGTRQMLLPKTKTTTDPKDL